ncbi:extracellular solute-binding protein [Cohnella thailandensis]|uniref:Extracellular solute-binding protein n=1 Tax=Cohnella thailandensis TaxID=557557 RepID=A0A841SNX0_9BACL|nr:extracellular solute-binding protein [Cohnella thailandensis]MBB6632882.1 extracellular solute-binding protein [Cohnella thailandensis]MBP1975424.1 putative aldouronate transport system substrate-binding protein [Cohnella thailandensis]
MKAGARKFISIAFATLMLGSSLSACSSNGNQTSGNTEPSSSTQNTASESTSKKHRTLTVEVFDRGKPGQPDLNNNYWTKYINDNFGKQYNATVNFVTVPRSQEVEKLNVLMASSDAPDIVFTYDSATVYKYVQQGGLTDLGPVLEQHGSALTDYLGDDILKYGQFNGKQYAIPAKRTFLAGFNTFIRKDWLDKLGLPVPTTAEQFYETMVAFKEKNPGNVSGVIPYAYTLSSTNPGVGNIFEAFKPSNLSEKEFATLQASNLSVPPWNLPGYDKAVQYLNKMYHEGLISPYFATDKDGKQSDADISNGKVGAFHTNWDGPYRTAPGIYTNLKANVPDAELIPIGPWQNDAGKHPKQGYSPNGIYIFVPKFSKNADLAIQYLNWMADPKNTLFLQNGKEGEDYNMVNGVPVQTGTTTSGDKMMTVANNLDYDILSNGIELGDPEKNAAAVSAGYPGFEKEVENALKVSMEDYYAPYYYSMPNEAESKYRTQLTNLSAQLLAKLIVAKPAEFDSLYKSSVQQYMDQGGKALLDEYIKNYDAQNGQ